MAPMNPRLLRPTASGVFDPRTIAGLAVWLDASVASSVTLNSGNVSEWRDLSGNGRHASQVNAGNQPSYSVAHLNGRNVVVAQDGSRVLRTAAFPAGFPNTVFVVVNTTGAINQGIFQRGAVNSVHSLWNSGANVIARRGGTSDATIAPASGFQVITGIYTTTLSRIFLGATQGTDNTATLTNITDNRTLALFNLDSLFGMTGGIAEFLYYNAQLSTAEQTTVRSYLSKKWSVAL